MLNQNKKQEYANRLFYARLRVIAKNGFFGMLLMPMRFLIDKNCKSASTDGKFIYFNPDFLDNLSDGELEYVILHELLHCAMGHICRAKDSDGLFDYASDIVVNATIKESYGGDDDAISIGRQVHLSYIPGQMISGEFLSAEDACLILQRSKDKTGLFTWDDHSRWRQQIDKNGEQQEQKDDDGIANNDHTSQKQDNVSLATKQKDANCDGQGMTADDGAPAKGDNENQKQAQGGQVKEQSPQDGQNKEQSSQDGKNTFDKKENGDETDAGAQMKQLWDERVEKATGLMQLRVEQGSKSCGNVPAFAQRMFGKHRRAQTDWRAELIAFVQQEVTDYSFSPPDRRFDESPFFLPDFNHPDDSVKDLLFMVDTSGSMSDKMITNAYSEVKGAIDQFNGKLKGWIGFFDAKVTKPIPFADEDEFKVIRPYGGGGTSFGCIFSYVSKNMKDNPPACIIILTDGYADFPKEHVTMGIPVLWVVNNKEVTPPWGRVLRIT